MTEARRIVLDLPYAFPFMTRNQIALVRPQWGIQYGMWIYKMGQGQVVPRLADPQALKERALWQLLLYDTVVMPMPTVSGISTSAGGLSRPLSPELEQLRELNCVEMLDEPPPHARTHISGDLVRALRPIIVADLGRDNIGVQPLEYEFAEEIIGSPEYEQLKEAEERLYNRVLPGLSQELAFPQKPNWEELRATVVRESLGPASVVGITEEQLEEKVYLLARDSIERKVGLEALKRAGKAEILNLYGKMREVEDAAERLRILFVMAAAKDADIKLDMAPVKDPSYTPTSLTKGGAIDQVVSVFVEVAEFPRIHTVKAATRHRGMPYIAEMRKAIFGWADAVAGGDLQAEADLRREIQNRVNKAGRSIGRTKACRMSLGALAWASGAASFGTAMAGLAPIAAFTAATAGVATLGKEFVEWFGQRQSSRQRWLLYGRET